MTERYEDEKAAAERKRQEAQRVKPEERRPDPLSERPRVLPVNVYGTVEGALDCATLTGTPGVIYQASEPTEAGGACVLSGRRLKQVFCGVTADRSGQPVSGPDTATSVRTGYGDGRWYFPRI